MYCAKQRAESPLVTCSPATEQPGTVTADGVNVTPTALNFFTNACWLAVIPFTSPWIAAEPDAISGVPVICCVLRFALTVSRPFAARTIDAMPNAIRTAAATIPPISNALRIFRSFPPVGPSLPG